MHFYRQVLQSNLDAIHNYYHHYYVGNYRKYRWPRNTIIIHVRVIELKFQTLIKKNNVTNIQKL